MREDCMELGPITSSRREECLPRIVGHPSVRDKIEKSRLYIYQGGWCSSSRGIEWHSNIFIKSVWTWKSHLRLYLSEVYSRNVLRRREYFEYLLQFSIIRNSFRFFFFRKAITNDTISQEWSFDLVEIHVVPVKFTSWILVRVDKRSVRQIEFHAQLQCQLINDYLIKRPLCSCALYELREYHVFVGNDLHRAETMPNHGLLSLTTPLSATKASCDCVIASV